MLYQGSIQPASTPCDPIALNGVKILVNSTHDPKNPSLSHLQFAHVSPFALLAIIEFDRGRSYQIVKVEDIHIKKHDITSEIFLIERGKGTIKKQFPHKSTNLNLS